LVIEADSTKWSFLSFYWTSLSAILSSLQSLLSYKEGWLLEVDNSWSCLRFCSYFATNLLGIIGCLYTNFYSWGCSFCFHRLALKQIFPQRQVFPIAFLVLVHFKLSYFDLLCLTFELFHKSSLRDGIFTIGYFSQ
jgi:hypothetical protein